MPEKQNYFSFWFLVLVVFLGFTLILGFLWFYNIFGTSVFINIFFLVLSLFLTTLFLILITGLTGIWFVLRKNKLPVIFQLPMALTVNYFFGFVVRAGEALGFSREKLQSNYINLTNSLVKNQDQRFWSKDILVLAPHCIQEANCPHRVTHDLNNCRKCGKCQIGNLSEIRKDIGFRLEVVTGGTAARQMVKKIKPKAIIAVACERDLMSGIQEVFPHPVLGVVNIRPQGPCFNTEVDWTELERAIKSLCKEVG